MGVGCPQLGTITTPTPRGRITPFGPFLISIIGHTRSLIRRYPNLEAGVIPICVMSSVRCFTQEQAEREITRLADLLMDSMDSGASGASCPRSARRGPGYCRSAIATVPLDEVLAAMKYGDRSTA
jgi:hypothetical protein